MGDPKKCVKCGRPVRTKADKCYRCRREEPKGYMQPPAKKCKCGARIYSDHGDGLCSKCRNLQVRADRKRCKNCGKILQKYNEEQLCAKCYRAEMKMDRERYSACGALVTEEEAQRRYRARYGAAGKGLESYAKSEAKARAAGQPHVSYGKMMALKYDAIRKEREKDAKKKN